MVHILVFKQFVIVFVCLLACLLVLLLSFTANKDNNNTIDNVLLYCLYTVVTFTVLIRTIAGVIHS